MSTNSDILSHLVQNLTAYLSGFDVYTDNPPDTQNRNCVIFKMYNGRQDILTPLKTQSMQVLIFSTDKLAGENLADSLFNFLHNKLNYVLGDYRLLAISGRDRPTFLGERPASEPSKKFFIYSTTYDFPFVEVS